MRQPVIPAQEQVGRKLRYGLTVGLTTLLAACGANKPAHSVSAENSNSGSNGTAGKTISPSDFAWGNRQTLTRDTFGRWNPSNPEPLKAIHLTGDQRYLLVVDDGRFNYPQDPNPNTDAPTGLYPVPTQKSQAVTEVPDGTVLKVVGWTDNGESISDAHGGPGYPTWEEVEGRDSTKAWVPWVNVGYTALQELHQLPKPATGM